MIVTGDGIGGVVIGVGKVKMVQDLGVHFEVERRRRRRLFRV